MAAETDTPFAPLAATARRALLRGAGGLAAAAAVASCQPAHAAAGADARLIADCAAWREAMDREMAVTDRLGRMMERDWSDADHALFDEAGDAVSELEGRVFGTKATTLAGIQAKAGVLDYLAAAAGIPAEPDHAASLVADVLAFGGAA